MKRYSLTYLLSLGCIFFAISSCSYPKNFTKDFYTNNEHNLLFLKDQFRQLYDEKPFAILFEDKSFNNIGFEIITDTLKYIYHFNLTQSNFTDTLNKYNFNSTKMLAFINGLQKIQCTWITNLDYYEDFKKHYLVLMAVRNKALNNTFKGESYCTLAFFNRDQPFDAKGRLLDRADKKQTRKINDAELYRVNARVGYAITKHYR